ncbi:MAG: hypothetical protein A2919_00760 [Candidatus Spechtbacteria bacterium RIFCSPLOWO2_01_FULL_43_12]|uniref:Uncharacterized protein n=1 Tax=Candidatus Spechtbacteria bacterium RIFCSPLOWO2_01_FULL_43_12 TaxID=1802162 RepID=A0A1G2HEV8_9BACT|nr:MAG: hypothetical protein A2919_00760 [Candidatus Spechtbacteria bacterium RIFCSPLOWO2_01_FULL_43_12]
MARIVSEHKTLQRGEIYIEEGWELVQDGPQRHSSSLSPIGFLLPDEEYIWLKELRERAIAFGAYAGQSTAEWLFDNQDVISAKWRRFNLVFPATMWRDLTGSLRIPYLAWTGEQWDMMFYWADQKFNSLDRIMHSHD